MAYSYINAIHIPFSPSLALCMWCSFPIIVVVGSVIGAVSDSTRHTSMVRQVPARRDYDFLRGYAFIVIGIPLTLHGEYSLVISVTTVPLLHPPSKTRLNQSDSQCNRRTTTTRTQMKHMRRNRDDQNEHVHTKDAFFIRACFSCQQAPRARIGCASTNSSSLHPNQSPKRTHHTVQCGQIQPYAMRHACSVLDCFFRGAVMFVDGRVIPNVMRPKCSAHTMRHSFACNTSVLSDMCASAWIESICLCCR